MLTYIARPRGLYKEPMNAQLEFPCAVELAFTFEPSSTFGAEGSPSRTVPLGANARLGVNFCKGELTVSTDTCLEPLAVELSTSDGVIVFEGATMRVSFEAQSRAALESVLETYYYCVPSLLSIDLIDAPIVSEIRGTAGQVPFCWAVLDTSWHKFDAVTKQIQEERVFTAFKRLKLLDESNGPQNRRLLAATQYFYSACRLNRTGNKLWEFLSESLLNEAKILEILFPAPPQKTIEYARSGLKSLEFTDLEIDALFIPSLALRNAIDIAHPTLAVFSTNESTILWQYADKAEDAFRKLLQRVFQRVEAGTFVLQPVQDVSPSAEARRVVQRIAENLANYENIQETS